MYMSDQQEDNSYIKNIYKNIGNGKDVFADYFFDEELEQLYTYLNNLLEYFKEIINCQHFEDDGNSSKEISEIEVRELYNRKINMILSDIDQIKKWYHYNDKLLPGSIEYNEKKKMQKTLGKKVLKRLEKIKEREERQGHRILHKRDAFELLKKMEIEDFKPTAYENNNIINHKSFNSYRSDYTKSKMQHFVTVARKILNDKVLSLEKFYKICNCPDSDYYKNYYRRSFLDFWAKEYGEFNKIKLGQRYKDGTPQKEPVFRMKI